MDGVGIKNGDIIVVDRSLDPKDGDIALCVLNGEFTLKRLKFKSNGEIYLVPENPNFKEIKVKETDDFQIWGIVTYIIHKTR
jgi:DNA polymerase V